MKTVFMMSSYNDPAGIRRAIDTSNGFFDKYIIVEGRYEGYIEDKEYNPYDIVDEFKDSKTDVIVMDGFKQIEKRNKYFELSDGFDFGLVIDSDEWLQILPELFNESLEQLKDSPERCFPVEAVNLSLSMRMPRLFRKPFGLHHKQSTTPNALSHASIFDENGKEVIDGIWRFKDVEKGANVRGIKMHHDKELRSQERCIGDLIYQQTVLDR